MPIDEQRDGLIRILADTDFTLVIAIDQEEAEIERYGYAKSNRGFCYGYCEYWKLELLLKDIREMQQEFTRNVPLNDQIIKLNRQKSCIIHRKKIKAGNSFKDVVATIAEKYLASTKPKTMIEILLLERLNANITHDVRAYWDQDGYLHWLDSNGGWFKSKIANPSIDSISKFLLKLFRFLGYIFFKFCSKQRVYELKLELMIKPRLTFTFDKRAEAALIDAIVQQIEPSQHKKTVDKLLLKPAAISEPSVVVIEAQDDTTSDDEPEAEQLKRWVANMRLAV